MEARQYGGGATIIHGRLRVRIPHWLGWAPARTQARCQFCCTELADRVRLLRRADKKNGLDVDITLHRRRWRWQRLLAVRSLGRTPHIRVIYKNVLCHQTPCIQHSRRHTKKKQAPQPSTCSISTRRTRHTLRRMLQHTAVPPVLPHCKPAERHWRANLARMLFFERVFPEQT